MSRNIQGFLAPCAEVTIGWTGTLAGSVGSLERLGQQGYLFRWTPRVCKQKLLNALSVRSAVAFLVFATLAAAASTSGSGAVPTRALVW
jgi:hypothetical protein